MKQMCFRSVVALFVFAAALQGQSRDSLIQTVSEASNWSPTGSPADYDETTLSQLSATIAPVASRYGLIGVTVQDWQGPSGSVRSTLYEMLDSTSAYGLFAWQRTRRDENFPVGAEGFRSPSGATFWQS